MAVTERQKIRTWLIHQLRAIETGDFRTVGKKISRVFEEVFRLLLIGGLIPVAALLIILWPVVRIRIGYFSADRIGHFAFDLEYYLASRHLHAAGKQRTHDLFFLKGEVCNRALEHLAKEKILIWQPIEYLYSACCFFPITNVLIKPARELTGSRDHSGFFANTSTNLTSLENLHRKLPTEDLYSLKRVGVDKNSKFVCLIVRDSAYLESLDSAHDWSYHSYRDTEIDLYADVAQKLVDRGYLVFRMGKVVDQPFPIKHTNIIDYATTDWKSDYLDLWLIAHSQFCISTSTGLDSLADVFRKPIALVNFLPLSYFPIWSRCVLAPCHLVWKGSGKKLNASEHLYHSYMRSMDYSAVGIEVRPLSPTETSAVVLEMDDLLSWSGERDATLSVSQEKFRSLLVEDDNKIIARGKALQPKSKQELSLKNRRRPTVDRAFPINPEALVSESFLAQEPEFLN